MKHIKQNLIFAALAAFAVLTASCFTPLDPPPSAVAEGAGQVILTVSPGQAGSARTILPRKNQVFNRYELVFSKAGEDNVTPDDTSDITGIGVSQELAAGTWTATVNAYNSFTPTDGKEEEYLAARGSEEVSVTAGQSVQVTVNLEPVMETGVKGIFTYTVTFPTVDKATMSLGSDYSTSLTSGTKVSVGVEPGYYDLTITLSKADGTVAGAAEKVHIYSGLESEAEYVFDDNFSLLKGPGDKVTATQLSTTSIFVSWDSVSGASSYKVYRNDSADGEYTAVTSLTGTSYTDTGLSANTIYYYKVTAVTGGAEGPKSDYAVAATWAPAPSTITATQRSSSSILVLWDSVLGATSYKVYRSEGLYPYNGMYTLVGSSTETSYTDTGLSPSTIYYYKVSAVGSAGEGSQTANYASATTMTDAEDTTIEGVYIGIISFAGEVSDMGLVRLDKSGSGRYSLVNWVNSQYTISNQGGTALFYAVHKTLANLTSKEDRYPANLDSVNVITFTDGLDNGSTGMSAIEPIEGHIFDRENDYTAYVNEQITNRTIADKSITAYSIGVKGNDVTNAAKFESDLEKIASTGNSRILTDFGNLQTTFQDIADSLQITQTANTGFMMKTTLLPSGTKVRMTFDVTGMEAADAELSSKYIEGNITRTGMGTNIKYTFNDITYAGGLGSEQGMGPITGVRNGSEVNFAFTGVEGYDPSTDDESNTKQWLMSSGETEWQRNSEYSAAGATTTDIESLSSIIYLVLDSSTSLESGDIERIRSAAVTFINSLYSQLYIPVPLGVNAAAAGSSSITVSWKPVSGATYYNVYRSTSSEGEYSQVGNSTSSTSLTDTGLSADTTYYYKVSAKPDAYDTLEGAQSSSASATTRVGAPSSNVIATAVSSSSITVSWDPVSGATYYNVYRSTSSEGEYSQVGNSTSSTSLTDTELSANTTYYYKVSAFNDNGEGAQSSSFSTRTKLFTPSNVIATAVSSSSITVSWDPVSGATYYKVYRSTSSEGEYSQVGSTSSPYTSYTDTGLSPNTTYYYKVSAYNSSYAGSASESLPSLTSETTRVAFPLNVSATAASSSSITVSWEQVSGATEYKVYRSTTYYGTYSLAGDSTSTSYADTELSPITTYYYKVSAYNGKGEGAQSSYTYATTKLGIPSIVTATDSSRSSITVSWNSVSNASYYYIYRATSSDGEYSQVGSTSSSYTSYTDTGLSPNTTYYYKVSAYSNNYNEESAQSPDFPCTITVTAAQVTVSFTEPKDETITVTQSQNDSGVLTVSVSGSFSSYRWFLDGVPVKDETESSLTLDIGELAPKRHELTVFVTDEKSVQYAKALRFTVWK